MVTRRSSSLILVCSVGDLFAIMWSCISRLACRDVQWNDFDSLYQVFENAPPVEMTERFPDILQFSSHTAKLMVSEIKKRATNLSTGESVARLFWRRFP